MILILTCNDRKGERNKRKPIIESVKELVKKANELLISFMRAVNARSTNKRTE